MGDKLGKKSKASLSKFSGQPPQHSGDTSEGSTNPLTLVFSFEKMQSRTGYSVKECDVGVRAALANKLFELGQLTWSQIVENDRKGGMGHEKMDKDELRAPVSHISEAVKILVFRFFSEYRLLGYREGRVFHILFVDSKLTIYKHG